MNKTYFYPHTWNAHVQHSTTLRKIQQKSTVIPENNNRRVLLYKKIQHKSTVAPENKQKSTATPENTIKEYCYTIKYNKRVLLHQKNTAIENCYTRKLIKLSTVTPENAGKNCTHGWFFFFFCLSGTVIWCSSKLMQWRYWSMTSCGIGSGL